MISKCVSPEAEEEEEEEERIYFISYVRNIEMK